LLHPPELDELGLQSALTRYIDGFAQRSGILVDVEVSPDLGRLPQQMETTIFRMVQECLTNIHRHSGSKTARLRLRRGPAEILLEVEDSGNGIRGDAAPGVGISSMRERAQQLDGNLEVRSDSNGTTVQAIFPLSRAAV
jgi:signal transduction histidine kinase